MSFGAAPGGKSNLTFDGGPGHTMSWHHVLESDLCHNRWLWFQFAACLPHPQSLLGVSFALAGVGIPFLHKMLLNASAFQKHQIVDFLLGLGIKAGAGTKDDHLQLLQTTASKKDMLSYIQAQQKRSNLAQVSL
jgi:hypothetical protein